MVENLALVNTPLHLQLYEVAGAIVMSCVCVLYFVCVLGVDILVKMVKLMSIQIYMPADPD